MASIVRFREGWRAHIYVRGERESRLFPTRREAERWGAERESELKAGTAASYVPYQSYEPLPLDRLRTLPEVTGMTRNSGVYFLWAEGGSLVYVGQSKDVAMRVAMHRRKPPAGFQRATYIKVAHPWQLAIERLYIDRYLGEALDPASGVCLANCA